MARELTVPLALPVPDDPVTVIAELAEMVPV
jgi:hypothetical protein